MLASAIVKRHRYKQSQHYYCCLLSGVDAHLLDNSESTQPHKYLRGLFTNILLCTVVAIRLHSECLMQVVRPRQ